MVWCLVGLLVALYVSHAAPQVAPIVASVVGLLPFTLEEYVSYTHGRSWQRKLSKLMSEFWGTGVVVYTAALTQGTGNALPTLSIGAMLVVSQGHPINAVWMAPSD